MTREQRNSASQISRAEWAVAALGAVLVLATVIFLAVDLTRGQTSAPAIALTVDSVMHTPTSFVVQIKAENLSGRTAAAARVVGTLLDASGQTVEASEVTLDYLPGNSARTLGLFFHTDPSRFRLNLRATGYQVP